MSERQNRRPEQANSLPENQTNEESIDLVELMYRLLASWKLIVCLALVFAVAAGAYSIFFVTPMYQATSTIYVLSRRDSAINISDLQIGTALTNDYLKVFDMWEVHEEVISDLQLPYSYSEMRSMLSVTNDKDTRMLDITITSPHAEETALIANEYAKVVSQYIADTMATDKPSTMSVARVPTNPVNMKWTRNIIVGFLLGCLLAVGIIVVVMLRDDKYKTAEDIRQYTGLVTLSMVPFEAGVGGKAEKKKNAGRARR